MSVNICWRPANDKGKSFKSGTSTTLAVLQEVFGNQISADDADKLRAMASATKDDFYNEIADTVDRVGSIVVWGEY